MGRVRYATRNIIFGFLGSGATTLLNFILRQVFITHLGDTLLGVQDLYSEILTMLSLAELGVGTALNSSLYGPVARGEREKIKSYMQLYKKAYRTIAIVIAVIGLALVPFLPWIVKNADYLTLSQLRVYYLLFLFNTVTTYFVAYKYSLANAEQKNYIQTNADAISKAVSVVLQLLGLLVLPNYLLYLLIQVGVSLGQKIFISCYLNRKYPLLLEKNVEPLTKEETGEVVDKTKALMLHRAREGWYKIIYVAPERLEMPGFQRFAQEKLISMVGLIGTYKMIVNSVSGYVNLIFNSVISSFGNLIATESREKQFQLFLVYRFFAIWVYGFSAVGFFLLLSPLVELYVGADRVLATSIIAWYLTDYFFKGERVVLSNFKTAAGVFEQDKYLSILQGIVNLVLSIALVFKIGLAGVFIGTVVSGLIANITKPIIIYRVCFEKSAVSYFQESIKYLLVIGAALAVLIPLQNLLMPQVTIAKFALMIVIITVVFNGIFLIVFGRTEEFKYLYGMVKGRWKRS